MVGVLHGIRGLSFRGGCGRGRDLLRRVQRLTPDYFREMVWLHRAIVALCVIAIVSPHLSKLRKLTWRGITLFFNGKNGKIE